VGTKILSCADRNHQKGNTDVPRKPSFGNHIRSARLKRKLSVAEVAEQMGVSDAAVYMWETDRSRPRDANLSALCKVLKLPVRATKAMAGG
jgi:transcriptional regulator with XRE-family HTH domain